MSMLSQATARALVDRLTPAAPVLPTKLWTGEGQRTRTGHRIPSVVSYWHGSELRCHSADRAGFARDDYMSLDAPARICTGGVAYSHTTEGQPWAFASEERP
ncbi:MAG: hypothetical protein RJA36_38 [Pseudomonadota bacterium]|jgi:hypothetical protein